MPQVKQKTYLTYALDADGKLIHVDSVPTGLACKCYCPHCKSELVAKNGGTRKVHHFAHAFGSDCVGAIESAIHKMAKGVLQEHKLIMLPPIQQNGIGMQIEFSKVETEVFDKELSLRPDCVGYKEDGRIMWVEFKRTHEVDAKKFGKIISAKVDCVEIDLNSCELDPVKVRAFIEGDCKGRKWIYSHESSLTFQTCMKGNYHQYYDAVDSCNCRQKIQRHIAVDEQKTIVDLFNFVQIDANIHSYFCIACGKEVYIDVDAWGRYSFVHIDEDALCDDDYYLHEAAKKVLCEIFNASQRFELPIPQKHLCEKRNRCLLFNETDCSINIPITYDLKTHGYNSCEIEYRFPHKHFSYDAVLKRGDDFRTAIVIIIDADTCRIDHGVLENRTIEVCVRCENDIFKLFKDSLRGEIVRFCKFKTKDIRFTSRENICRKVLKFTLFSSGKYHLGIEDCISAKRSAIYEMVILNNVGNFKSIKQYAVLNCHKRQRVICLCEICHYLKFNDDFIYGENICIRYKTKGTPRNPLKTMPIKCPYFRLDKKLEISLLNEFHNLKFKENDYMGR